VTTPKVLHAALHNSWLSFSSLSLFAFRSLFFVFALCGVIVDHLCVRHHAELQVNALDVLKAVKDFIKEGVFLGEPTIKSAPLFAFLFLHSSVSQLV
jgi:hypothetical protein